jgi:hypothetical protein
MPKTMPGWLHERVNDPCGTTNRHPFWQTVDFERIGSFNVFKRDGVTYTYDRRHNAWYGFADLAAALAHIGEFGDVDPWT